MRVGLCPAFLLLLLGAGCAESLPPTPALPQAVAPVAAGGMTEFEIASASAQLRASLLTEVPHAIVDIAGDDRAWIDRAKVAIRTASFAIERPQLLVVADRNPSVQQLRIVLARPDAAWQVIGGSKVSTGQAGRRGYFITPTGVFPHTDAILDYRALGTFNENHIRGLGLAGMRVWDFGWQTAERGWHAERDLADIRLLMHATDPDYLEQRLGRPASQGCVRVPAAMNRFLDIHGVLDADYERAARDDVRIRAVLLPVRTPTPLAGEALVIIDSSQGG